MTNGIAEPKLITNLNCQTEELPFRNAKLNCQLELLNLLAESNYQTELPH
jgi:hypothetical protein